MNKKQIFIILNKFCNKYRKLNLYSYYARMCYNDNNELCPVYVVRCFGCFKNDKGKNIIELSKKYTNKLIKKAVKIEEGRELNEHKK